MKLPMHRHFKALFSLSKHGGNPKISNISCCALQNRQERSRWTQPQHDARQPSVVTKTMVIGSQSFRVKRRCEYVDALLLFRTLEYRTLFADKTRMKFKYSLLKSETNGPTCSRTQQHSTGRKTGNPAWSPSQRGEWKSTLAHPEKISVC